MRILYEGTDLAGWAEPVRCVHRDAAGGRADCLDITFDRADTWARWAPRADDVIEAEDGGYRTGKCYVCAIRPEGNRFRILAASTPQAARQRGWACCEAGTLGELLHRTATECRMKEAFFGLDADLPLPFTIREDEGCAAFLARLLRREGASLKCFDGRMNAVSLLWAQERAPVRSFRLTAGEDTGIYTRRNGHAWSRLTVAAPACEASATDTEAADENPRTIAGTGAQNESQAGRWARGLLLSRNREAEEIELTTAFDPALTALARITITGDTAGNGDYLIDEAEHDLTDRTSRILCRRCVTTIR